MGDELGFEYMQEHFEPYTRCNPPAPRCLIVDGHSSHVAWGVFKYALGHDVHMVCLPSKSTHLLQPLDVGCFGILQTTYERNLSAWLRKNPSQPYQNPPSWRSWRRPEQRSMQQIACKEPGEKLAADQLTALDRHRRHSHRHLYSMSQTSLETPPVDSVYSLVKLLVISSLCQLIRRSQYATCWVML